MKIVVLDGYAANPGDLSWGALARMGELTVYDRTAPADVVARAKGAEIILTNKTVLNADTLRQLPELKYISVLATGTNIVDGKAARELGIAVSNVPAYSTHSVAQQVFALLLAICNRAEHYGDKNRLGAWAASPDFSYSDTELRELYGSRIGIVGFGNIGQAVARIAEAFGMEVAVYTSREQQDLPDGYVKVGLDELFETSDVVTLHCPLTPDTAAMVSAERIALMKRGAILINTARGPLVDEKALAGALAQGKLAGVGVDVMVQEPPEADNPLLARPECISTPHVAWATKAARQRLLAITAANIASYMVAKPQNVVN